MPEPEEPTQVPEPPADDEIRSDSGRGRELMLRVSGPFPGFLGGRIVLSGDTELPDVPALDALIEALQSRREHMVSMEDEHLDARIAELEWEAAKVDEGLQMLRARRAARAGRQGGRR